jgi:hypothetical protein
MPVGGVRDRGCRHLRDRRGQRAGLVAEHEEHHDRHERDARKREEIGDVERDDRPEIPGSKTRYP